MVFTKYLFSVIAGLTGGVNAWAFSSSGGARVSEELNNISNDLNKDSNNKEGLLKNETDRLDKEKAVSEANFNKLNKQNEDTQEKSRKRRSAANDLRQANGNLNWERAQQNYQLEQTGKELSEKLKTKTEEFRDDIKKKVESYKEQLSNVIKTETDKLEQALKTLQLSNKELIEEVRCKIEGLPDAIFESEPFQKCTKKPSA